MCVCVCVCVYAWCGLVLIFLKCFLLNLSLSLYFHILFFKLFVWLVIFIYSREPFLRMCLTRIIAFRVYGHGLLYSTLCVCVCVCARGLHHQEGLKENTSSGEDLINNWLCLKSKWRSEVKCVYERSRLAEFPRVEEKERDGEVEACLWI